MYTVCREENSVRKMFVPCKEFGFGSVLETDACLDPFCQVTTGNGQERGALTRRFAEPGERFA